MPVLVLNACRSAYTEAPSTPGDPGFWQRLPSPVMTGTRAAGPLADVHARIRAYGSLAAEVADAGVPGVVAMRYNVYVATAAQYTADLYAHLLAGKPLGQAATAARRALAADPAQQITSHPGQLPGPGRAIIYDFSPFPCCIPFQRDAPLISTLVSPSASPGAGGGVPGPPDAGFFGRDETLLALDRAFDAQQVVLLHAFAGAGKSSTAAEFTRWYRTTGGLDDPAYRPGRGAVVWLRASLAGGPAAGCGRGPAFPGCWRRTGSTGRPPPAPARRRDLILQVLAQVPVLWVWDNIEPVTGFPAGTQSPWTQAEQDDLTAIPARPRPSTPGARCC